MTEEGQTAELNRSMRYTMRLGTRMLKSEIEGKSEEEVEKMVFAKWESNRKEAHERVKDWNPGVINPPILDEKDITEDEMSAEKKALLA